MRIYSYIINSVLDWIDVCNMCSVLKESGDNDKGKPCLSVFADRQGSQPLTVSHEKQQAPSPLPKFGSANPDPSFQNDVAAVTATASWQRLQLVVTPFTSNKLLFFILDITHWKLRH